MRIKIKVKPNSSQEKVEKISDIEYEVWLKEKPVDGKANLKLIKILSKYFSTQECIPSHYAPGIPIRAREPAMQARTCKQAPKNFQGKCLLGAKEVKIKSGFTSRNKIIEIEN